MGTKPKYKVDAMDLSKDHIAVLEQWIAWLKEESSSGICVPIKARMRYPKGAKSYSDEWEPATDWEVNK